VAVVVTLLIIAYYYYDTCCIVGHKGSTLLEESLRVMTGDDETPPEKAVPAFVKSKLDVYHFCLNYSPPDRDAWNEL
jgi:hypothetical protein